MIVVSAVVTPIQHANKSFFSWGVKTGDPIPLLSPQAPEFDLKTFQIVLLVFLRLFCLAISLSRRFLPSSRVVMAPPPSC